MCTHAVDSDEVSCLPDNLGKIESLLEGDPIPIFHFKDVDTCSIVTRVDATAQFTTPMYASDFAHSWSNFGMDTPRRYIEHSQDQGRAQSDPRTGYYLILGPGPPHGNVANI